MIIDLKNAGWSHPERMIPDRGTDGASHLRGGEAVALHVNEAFPCRDTIRWHVAFFFFFIFVIPEFMETRAGGNKVCECCCYDIFVITSLTCRFYQLILIPYYSRERYLLSCRVSVGWKLVMGASD